MSSLGHHLSQGLSEKQNVARVIIKVTIICKCPKGKAKPNCEHGGAYW